MRYHVENGDSTESDEMPEDHKKIIMEEPPHDEETFTTNRSHSEKQKSENVSDDDVYDQTLATILHETDNSNMYYCSKDSDYDSTRRDSGKYMLSGCELIDTNNISLASQNMKFVGEWAKRTSHKLQFCRADIFQYQSYSHSDDIFIILKSTINTDTSIFVFSREKLHDSKYSKYASLKP